MKVAERIVMILILFVLLGGGVWLYVGVKQQQQGVRDAVARGEYEIDNNEQKSELTPEEWRLVYPHTVPITIGGVSVQASVADTLSQRMKGLSGTPFLPAGIVKLFAFGMEGSHFMWMKDMNYSLDIMWLAEGGEIVHIEENVAPETYPQSFSSPVPAWYVVEANAGFVADNDITVGDKVTISSSQ